MSSFSLIILWHDILSIFFVNLFHKIKINSMQKKPIGILLAAATAYGIYKYSKLSYGEKKDLMAKCRDFMDRNFGFGNLFGKTQAASAPNANNSF